MVWARFLGRVSVRVRMKDIKSMSCDNFLLFDLVISKAGTGKTLVTLYQHTALDCDLEWIVYWSVLAPTV